MSGGPLVIVGGGLAGWRLAESIYQRGFRDEIFVISDDDRTPYDRPPLSKHVLSGRWTLDKTALVDPASEVAAHVTWQLGRRVVGVDIDARAVTLDDGTCVVGATIVLATGVRARRMLTSAGERVSTLRTARDVEKIVQSLEASTSTLPVVVIGGGFLGAEVATSLRTRGYEVVILEAARAPLVGVVGERAAEWLDGMAEQAGVELLVNQRVKDIRVESSTELVVEREGDDPISAQFVLSAIGSELDLQWLEGSGLTLDNGIVVDDNFEASPGIYAIGDVANHPWNSPLGIRRVRLEHWQVAVDHATQLARALMTGESPSPVTPYFWSDQYRRKIQMLGAPYPDDSVELVHGALDDAQWLAIYSREGRVSGLLALGQPRALMLSKPLVDQGVAVSDALTQRPWAT